MAQRTRVSFKFWLNPRDEDERSLMEDISVLKRKKRFTQTVRDGIRLISSLREGRLDVLLHLFPWVWDQVALEIEKKTATATPKDDLKDMQAMLSRIDSLLSQQPATLGGVGATMDTGGTTQRPLRGGTPTEDVQLDIKQQTRDADNNPTWNFMIASTLQIYGKCDVLPPEVIEYGLRTKRIPPHAITQTKQTTRKAASAKKAPTESQANGPKAMEVPQFAPPTFDDDEDLLKI